MRRRTAAVTVAGLVLLAELIVVAAASTVGSDGILSVVGALIVGPVAVVAVAGLGRRVGGPWYGVAAAAAYVLLPLAATRYFLAGYDHTYTHRVLPELVGTRSLGWLTLGIAIVLAARFAPGVAFAAAAVVATVVALAVWGTGDLGAVKSGLHETGWSVALLEWLPVAGFVGAARRSPLDAVGLGGWLVFFVLRASHQPLDDGSFWRALAPALPAAAVLVASVGLLVPSLRGAGRGAR